MLSTTEGIHFGIFYPNQSELVLPLTAPGALEPRRPYHAERVPFGQFGNHVKKIRGSQKRWELAKHSKLSPPTIGMYEMGRALPQRNNGEKVYRAAGWKALLLCMSAPQDQEPHKMLLVGPEEMAAIKPWFAEMCQQRGLTHDAIAERVCVSPDTVGGFFRSPTILPATIQTYVARTLGFHVDFCAVKQLANLQTEPVVC